MIIGMVMSNILCIVTWVIVKLMRHRLYTTTVGTNHLLLRTIETLCCNNTRSWDYSNMESNVVLSLGFVHLGKEFNT